MGFSSLAIPLKDTGQLSATCFQPDSAVTPPNHLVVLMHGWGADSQDLLPLAPYLVTGQQSVAVVVPDAPDVCSANPFGRQWFELASPDLSASVIAQACQNAVPIIHQMLDNLSEHFQLSASKIILGGFSQGGMMGLSGGLRYPEPLGGIFCLSGSWLTPAQQIAQPLDVPIFLAHGAQDPVVPITAMQTAQSALNAKGFVVQTLHRPDMAHNIDAGVTENLARFITECF